MPDMSQISPCLWTQLPQSQQSPCDRYKHACCSHGGIVYILGGRGSSSLGDFWKYSVVCNEWTELNCASEAAPEELEEHSMVAHKGFLYVFGGMLDSAYSKQRCPLWVFDIETQKWLHWQGKMSSSQVQTPGNRKGHSAVVLGSTMLVYGGFIDIRGSSQEFWALDFAIMDWSLMDGSHQHSLGPGPRHSHSAVSYQDCMYLFGGLKGLREQRDVWRWSSSNHTWSCLKNKSGPSRLIGHSAVAYKDGMLVFGGGESQNAPKNCLWRYSFPTQTWEQVAALRGSNPPARIHHSCTGLGPSYSPVTAGGTPSCGTPSCGSGLRRKPPDGKFRPFRNKCYPAPLEFLGSECDIELQTFTPDRRCSGRAPGKLSGPERVQNAQQVRHCMTFENKAFRTQWSCTDGDSFDDEDADIAQHLPDLLLVLGGRPCSMHSLCVWQVTLTDS